MIYNELSCYPISIDPLVFFQDNGIEHVDELKKYQRLLQQEKYTEASTYLDFQSNLNGYFGSLFNCLENRIRKLQEHLKDIPVISSSEEINPIVVSNSEPSTITQNTIWIDEGGN